MCVNKSDIINIVVIISKTMKKEVTLLKKVDFEKHSHTLTSSMRVTGYTFM